MPDAPAGDTAITFQALPASYGDCLLVTCWRRDGRTTLLVDTGPDESSWRALRSWLDALPAGAEGRRRIDLAIVSHIDHDHIGNARALFGDATLGLAFGDVWFNARHHLQRGVAEGAGLAEILGASPDVPWNAAFGRGVVVTGDGTDAPTFVDVLLAPDEPRVTVLSPTPKRLDKLARVWDAELARLRAGESNTAPEDGTRGAAFPDLDALAALKPRLDDSVTNGSSIAVLVEHRGASVLLAADAFPKVLGTAIAALAVKRGTALPFPVDVFKLSHHGSAANLMQELLHVVRAEHYVVSTDNSRFGHPNDEALARVVLGGGSQPTLWFNYATERNLRWNDEAVQERYQFRARYPPPGGNGVRIDLRERARPTVGT